MEGNEHEIKHDDDATEETEERRTGAENSKHDDAFPDPDALNAALEEVGTDFDPENFDEDFLVSFDDDEEDDNESERLPEWDMIVHNLSI
jgi:hypothetical protein